MSIIDRLTQDLAEILEDELTREPVNLDRLCLTILLLVGWRRSGDRPSSNPTKSASAEEWSSHGNEGGEEDDQGAQEEDKRPALFRLRERVSPFSRANPYLNGLLFRDYRQDSQYHEYSLGEYGCLRLHPEACRYVDEVLLLRRLELARSIGKNPTNMHRLLEYFCRQSRAEDGRQSSDQGGSHWRGTEIRREIDGAPREEAWFGPVADALRAQIKELGDKLSKVSYNRRAADGPYWLHAGPCSERVGEELNLWEVLVIVPKPLGPGFSLDSGFRQLLKAVVGSLNTRYRLLRGCGLVPEDWLHRDEPSMDHLKDLAQLRKLAWSSPDWLEGRREEAFAQAFAALRQLPKHNGKVGGFASFEAWCASEEGDAMLHRGCTREISWEYLIAGITEGASLDDPEGRDPFAPRDSDTGASEDFPEERLASSAGGTQGDQGGLDSLLAAPDTMAQTLEDAGPRLADNPVLQAFFRWVLVEGRQWMGRHGLARQPAFQALLARDTRYAALSEKTLAVRLSVEASLLILDVRLETHPGPVSPALYAYLRRVAIEEQPEPVLFKDKSFKTLVAKEPTLNALSPEKLSAHLRRESLELLQTLFGAVGEPG